MKKIIYKYTLAVIMSILFISQGLICADGANIPNKIRVGITYGNENDDFVISSDSGLTISSENGNLNIKDEKKLGFKKDKIGGAEAYHIGVTNISDEYSTAEQCRDNLEKLGQEAYISYNSGYGVYVGTFATKEEASAYLSVVQGAAPNFTFKIVAPEYKSIAVYNAENKKVKYVINAEGSICISPSESRIPVLDYKGKKFRERLDLSRISGSDVTVINVLGVDQYLYGVVPLEITASMPMEALRAQGVAARNYVINVLNKHSQYGFDICDTTHCQVYGGYSKETERTNEAVSSTAGVLAYYDNTPITAFYSSTSGGFTANSEDVWGDVPVPYLRGKEDPYSLVNPYSSWSVVFTKEELNAKLKASKAGIGDLVQMRISSATQEGRVLVVEAIGTEKTKNFKKEELRNFLSLKSNFYTIKTADGGTTPAPNTNTSVYIQNKEANSKLTQEKVFVASDGKTEDLSLNDAYIQGKEGEAVKPKSPAAPPTAVSANSYTFNGRGYGHGVGMSQYGAIEMAKQGYTYTDILKFYYTGIEVK